MQYTQSKKFEKSFAKLSKSTKAKAIVVFQKFIQDPNDISLRNHELTGRWKNHFSINVTGDIRAVYVFVERDIIQFVAVGSHSTLYG